MQLNLRRGERIFLNGAVIRVDRRVSIELMNDAAFLLESHVMQPDEARTPLRQLYFTLQMMLLEPSRAGDIRDDVRAAILALERIGATSGTDGELAELDRLVRADRLFAGLKLLRRLIARSEEQPACRAAAEAAE